MLKTTFSKNSSQNFNKQCDLEWLETNGLGGYASSTANGINTRGYHGLLVAAKSPPCEREVLVSRLDEVVVFNEADGSNTRHELFVRQFPETIIASGSDYLYSIAKDTHPVFEYKIKPQQQSNISEEIIITKEVISLHEQDVTLVRYRLTGGADEIELELRPFFACRSFHARQRAEHAKYYIQELDVNSILIEKENYPLKTHIFAEHSWFEAQADWYYNFEFQRERIRGYDFQEDLFTPGVFKIKLRQDRHSTIALSTESPCSANLDFLFQQEIESRLRLIREARAEKNQFKRLLILAADQFIVQRGNGKSIIAGYPWFDDWGRDAMIALPGLCLSTRRFNDARQILETFSLNVKNGIIPNRFLPNGEIEYNSVDASLWYILAVFRYYKATRDLKFVRFHCLPVIEEIISHYINGTDFNIKCDLDGLLIAGTNETQLTWMDARIDRLAVTPRNGKAVEINALWYNALKIASFFSLRRGKLARAGYYSKLARQTKNSFQEKFWYSEGQYLFDVIDTDSAQQSVEKNDASLRPNQLIAISLPFSVLDNERAKKVLQVTENNLLTPVGLRSLSPRAIRYAAQYKGDVIDRDLAYHQGTVWLWLVGSYIRALKKYGKRSALEKANSVIKGFEPQMLAGGLGTLSEIFDGDFPHQPRGCIAQAWSVGEVLESLQ